ncbi:MAG TPA: hypothetical protein VI279_15695, partial [Rhodocyclaceae bacterium]
MALQLSAPHLVREIRRKGRNTLSIPGAGFIPKMKCRPHHVFHAWPVAPRKRRDAMTIFARYQSRYEAASEEEMSVQ